VLLVPALQLYSNRLELAVAAPSALDTDALYTVTASVDGGKRFLPQRSPADQRFHYSPFTSQVDISSFYPSTADRHHLTPVTIYGKSFGAASLLDEADALIRVKWVFTDADGDNHQLYTVGALQRTQQTGSTGEVSDASYIVTNTPLAIDGATGFVDTGVDVSLNAQVCVCSPLARLACSLPLEVRPCETDPHRFC
jgi:hypothetical protein